jgi:putative ABC transport system substrate-binding protein
MSVIAKYNYSSWEESMKSKKSFVTVLLLTALVCGMFAACGKKDATPTPAEPQSTDGGATKAPTDTSSTSSDKQYKLGVNQFFTHEALDAAYTGFIDGLKKAGIEVGKNLTVDLQNALGEPANAQTIAAKFANSDIDFILAIATASAQACANATKDIPVFVTAVTDPESVGIISTNKAPGGNVTGTSDLTPVKRQIELVKKLFPDTKTIGILYSSNEINSQIQSDMAEAEAAMLDISTEKATASQTSEIQSVVESLSQKVDVIYIPTDNMMASNIAAISLIATDAKVPVIVGEEGMVKGGGLATYGISYYNLGKQTAAMAAKVLLEGVNPGEMPIEYLEDTAFFYNKEIADALGVTIPEELLGK